MISDEVFSILLFWGGCGEVASVPMFQQQMESAV
jgi:hypothetical protein